MPCTCLVSTELLAQRLGDPSWVVFDCRHDLADPEAGARAYAESHIPGAHHLSLDRDLSAPATGRNGRHPLPDPQAFIELMGRCGVDRGKQVVAYDAGPGPYAARLWWMLRWMGHPSAAVLDGGLAKWLREQRPVNRELPAAAPAAFSASPQPAWVDAAFVQARLENPELCLIDARSPDRFRGQNETLDPVGGHIPGAVSRFFMHNLTPEGSFKPPQLLRQEFSRVIGSTAPQQVVHSCGSGVTACHNLLAMEVAGLHGSRLYAGSWSEWCSDPARPVVRET